MTLLTAESISKRFSDQIILDQVSFSIRGQDKIALVGKNGIGKTTLLEILHGKQHQDSGSISRSRACVIDYVEQEKSDYLAMTLFDFVAHSRADLIEMRRRIRQLEDDLEKNPSDSAKLAELGAVQHDFEQKGGFVFESEIETILQGLGFPQERYRETLRKFSGGERNRAGLARLLAGRGTLLLLDEPTNHLDIESTAWLEEYVSKLDKACIIVSHDRAFLNAVASNVWEIFQGKLEIYSGGFEFYLAERKERRRLAQHHYRHQQEEIKRIEEFIRRNMAGQKTRQAQSKLKYLSRIKRIASPKSDGRGPAIKLQSSGRSFNHVVAVENTVLGYGERAVLRGVSFDIFRGDKVGLIGRNGSGKSTLLRSLTGELEPLAGDIKLGSNVDVAYFDQELTDLNESATVLDNMWEIDRAAEAQALRSFLGRFGFSGEDAFKVVSALSGGEKTKLCLARLLYHPANFVILDEPTNHLDLYAREALESALAEYDGSLLVVSHDRYFLDQVVDRIIALKDGTANEYDGNYTSYREKTTVVAPKQPVKTEKDKQDYIRFKEESKRRSRLKKEIARTHEKITALEKELLNIVDEIEPAIPADDWQQLHDTAEHKKRLEEEIIGLYAELERLEAIPLD